MAFAHDIRRWSLREALPATYTEFYWVPRDQRRRILRGVLFIPAKILCRESLHVLTESEDTKLNKKMFGYLKSAAKLLIHHLRPSIYMA